MPIFHKLLLAVGWNLLHHFIWGKMFVLVIVLYVLDLFVFVIHLVCLGLYFFFLFTFNAYKKKEKVPKRKKNQLGYQNSSSSLCPVWAS